MVDKLFSVLVLLGIASSVVAQTPPITRTRLLQSAIPSVETYEALLVRVEVTPHAAAGKHYHHGVEIAYVVDGTATLMVEGQPPRQVKAGDSFRIGERVKHDVATADAKLTILSTYLVEKGKPLAEPAQ